MTTFSVEVTPSLFGQQLDALVGASGGVTPQQYNAPANGTDDDQPAWTTAFTVLRTAGLSQAQTGASYGTGSDQLTIPKSLYKFNTAFDVTSTSRIQGRGGGLGGGLASHIFIAPGHTAVRVQASNTINDTDVFTVVGQNYGGQGSIIDGISVGGQYGQPGVVEGEFHAFLMRATSDITNFQAWNTQGDAVNIRAGVFLPELGNANLWGLRRGLFQNTRNGAVISGSDTNVGLGELLIGVNVRAWGVIDQSLGATLINCLMQGCGASGTGTPTNPACGTTYNGNCFAVKVGREVQASTNHPPATSVSDANWLPWTTAAPGAAGTPNWVSGMTFRAGGSYRIDNGGLLLGCYGEGGAPAQLGSGTLLIGGSWDQLPYGGGQIFAFQNRVQINALSVPGSTTLAATTVDSLTVVAGSITFDDDVGAFIRIPRITAGGGAQYALISCSPSATDLQLRSPDNVGRLSIANAQVTINTATIDPTGNINMPTGAVLKVNGTQVVGPRDTGWTAGTGTSNKGAFAAYAGATMSGGYVQAEAQATNDAAKAANQRTLAIEAMLRMQGLIN